MCQFVQCHLKLFTVIGQIFNFEGELE
jgi:hypothetical protein